MSSYAEQAADLRKLQDGVIKLQQIVDAKARSIMDAETLIKQGQVPGSYPQNLDYNLRRNLGPMMAPGNVGDLNSVIWPFYFTTETPPSPIGPDETLQTGFSVTQEAAFIMMSFTKTVYVSEGDPEQWGYLNEGDVPSAPGLSFTLRDGSSSRQYFNSPINTDAYGNPRFPTKWPRPMMLLPNQVMQVQFINSSPVNSYVPFLTAFGYRMRVEDAQKFLSLVYG